MSAPGLEELEQRLGHRFRDPALLVRALTHASYAHEHPPEPDNEALAFLGDAALGLAVATHLWETGPLGPVGVLTVRRAALVSGANLARWAAAIGLAEHLRLGRGAELTGSRSRESVLATAMEAVLGAVYVEDGDAAVRRTVSRLAPW